MYTHIHIHIHIHICMYIYIYICIYTHICYIMFYCIALRRIVSKSDTTNTANNTIIHN